MQKSALDFAWTTLRYPRRHWQRLTAAWRILPDFIIIGANRSGTTSLYQYLIEHPLVRWAYKKEASFFSHGPHFKRGPKWYRQFFPSESFIAASMWTAHAATRLDAWMMLALISCGPRRKR